MLLFPNSAAGGRKGFGGGSSNPFDPVLQRTAIDTVSLHLYDRLRLASSFYGDSYLYNNGLSGEYVSPISFDFNFQWQDHLDVPQFEDFHIGQADYFLGLAGEN
jgi:hypothetical protein